MISMFHHTMDSQRGERTCNDMEDMETLSLKHANAVKMSALRRAGAKAVWGNQWTGLCLACPSFKDNMVLNRSWVHWSLMGT